MGSKNKNLSTNNCKTKQRQRPKHELHLLIICIISVIMVSLSIGIYAWARYTTVESGSAQAQVAKWNFGLKLKNGDNEVTEGSGVLDLAATLSYDHVADDRIAPGTVGEFQVIIDTTGTETDMVYDVIINITDCPRNLIFKRVDENNVETLLSGGEQTSLTRTLIFSKYLKVNPTSEHGVHTETIKWEWPYETGTTDEEIAANDDIDTLDEGRTVQMRISVRGTEVMNAPFTTSGLTYGDGVSAGTAIANGGTINLEVGATTTLSKALGTETVTYSSSDTTVATVSSAGVIEAVGEGTAIITVTGNETGETVQITVSAEVPSFKVDDITPAVYGQYVDIGTNILDKSITLSDGTNAQADWRVFRKESDGVWLILADYMPINKVPNTVGLVTSGTYIFRSTTSRADLISRLSDSDKWSGLISTSDLYKNGSLIDKNIEVKGAVDLTQWKESWNESYPNTSTYASNQLYIAEMTSAQNDGLKGYYVSRNKNVGTSTYTNMQGSQGYPSTSDYTTANTLYFPHAHSSSPYNGCCAYWLASPSATYFDYVMYVGYNGSVDYNGYSTSGYGVRPAVFLPSDIELDTSNDVWTIVDNQ